ncbi:MAG: EscN/YscN/HrcN family type secretion system ATPase, partial [Ramlibacter sp.]|nr:EscN/YscN/HrcN family type secretion system ATPase [Ramlibacter sp.]
EHKEAAGTVRELMAKYQDIELLLKVGEYKKGSDRIADIAIDKHEAIRQFLRQKTDEHVSWEETLAQLQELAR